MKRRRTRAQISAGDIGRFVVNTRRGRILASVYLAASALLGLGLGALGASEIVSTVVLIAFVAIAVPVILLQAIKASLLPHDGQPYAQELLSPKRAAEGTSAGSPEERL
jgi:hypothetical protein